MFVGDTGLERIIRRGAQLQKLDPNGDARAQGGIDLATVQRYINYWFSYCLDLFGSEVSTNAAEFFAAGLKGRFGEEKRFVDHAALGEKKLIDFVRDGKVVQEEVDLRNAMNQVLREDYIDDCDNAIRRWNKAIASEGVDFELKLPSIRFHRHQGLYSAGTFAPDGSPISPEQFESNRRAWLPTDADREYLVSIMQPVHEIGKCANWIAPPKKGINGQEFAYEYVRF